MNFELSEEQKLIQQAARDFARAEIQPIAAQYDREARFPMEVMDKAREVGLVNVTVPAEYGGSGLGVLELALVTQELAWACAGINGTLGLNCVIADVFHVAGSAEQKEQVFGRLNAGELGGYALTEPVAGSDVSAIATRAVRSVPSTAAVALVGRRAVRGSAKTPVFRRRAVSTWGLNAAIFGTAALGKHARDARAHRHVTTRPTSVRPHQAAVAVPCRHSKALWPQG